MADPKQKKGKKDNAIGAYFRSTRAELRRVRWPTLDQGWTMTKIVLLVTFSMAIFLGILDFLFGWLLGNIISGNSQYGVYLLDERNDVRTEREVHGRTVPMVEFHWQEQRIWGATAFMIRELRKILNKH